MYKSRNALLCAFVYLATVASLFAWKSLCVESIVKTPPTSPIVVPEVPDGPYDITHVVPEKYLTYLEVVERLKEWHKEAPKITEFGTYGKDRQGTDLCYLRIGTPGKPKVLIHACIHGNERLSSAATLGMMGQMLWSYKRDRELENADVAQANWVIANRDIYFVPVFAPETYLKQRWLEGEDPNRKWPYPGGNINNTATPILAMRKFFEKHKFAAVMDGHTYGRIFFTPSIASESDAAAFREFGRKMGELAGYSYSPVSSQPAGFAIDWYYWKGAVAAITEFGSSYHGHSQPASVIQSEMERVFPAYLYFMQRASEIRLIGPNHG